jgi:hypothetical protein
VGRDIAGGLAALALAAVYYAAASDIQKSFLADEVGAAGVPRLLAATLAVLGVLMIVRAVLRRKTRAATETETGGAAAHARALGLLALGIAYIVLAPVLGYLATTSVFIFAVAAYSGQKASARLAVISCAGGIFLWLMFVKLLGVAMPAGPLERLLG